MLLKLRCLCVFSGTATSSAVWWTVHHTLSVRNPPHRRWQSDLPRHQCITVAQIHTGHSPLLASYLHCIGRQDSTVCHHCSGTEEMAELLILQCPTHYQLSQETRPELQILSDPWSLWSNLEWIGVVTRPPPANQQWERELFQAFKPPYFVAFLTYMYRCSCIYVCMSVCLYVWTRCYCPCPSTWLSQCTV